MCCVCVCNDILMKSLMFCIHHNEANTVALLFIFFHFSISMPLHLILLIANENHIILGKCVYDSNNSTENAVAYM